MKLTMPGWLSWTAGKILRPRCYGVSVLLAAEAVGLCCCSLFAAANVAAVPPSPAPVPLPRMIRLVRSIPDRMVQFEKQLKTKAPLGKMELSIHLGRDVLASHRGHGRRAFPPFAARSEFFSYHNGNCDAVFTARGGTECYCGHKGNIRYAAVFDDHFVNKVFFVIGKRGVKAAALPPVPRWLAKGVPTDPANWNIPKAVVITPSLTISPAELWNCDSAAITINPCRAKFQFATGYFRFGFGRYRRGQAPPPLRTVEMSGLERKHGLESETILSIRTGTRTAALPIHLTGNSLAKLGFNAVPLTAKTPAPAINPLTPAQIARVRVMRERFEKWAGVWSRLHPGSQVKLKKSGGHK